MKTTLLSAATVLAIVTFSTALLAQTEALPNTPAPAADRSFTEAPAARQSGLRNNDTNKLSRSDRNFFEEAAKSGRKEVEVSNAVKSRLTNPQVRTFAEMIVADHSGVNTELQRLAAAKGATLPADKMNYTEKWTRNDGKIDEDYVETMEEDHEEAVKLFEKATKSDDADIAAFAQKTLPKLQQHLTEVRALKKMVK